jgi:hypothetical protein
MKRNIYYGLLIAEAVVFDALVTFAALRLLDELRANRYSSEAVAATKRMTRICATALAATALATIGFNILQLLCIKAIMAINMQVNIPVISLAFVLAALLLTRFIAENKKLKEDNDMFI